MRKAAEDGKGITTGAMRVGDDFVGGIISHPGHAAHPFLRPALDNNVDEIVAAIRSKIVAVVEGKTGFNIEAGIQQSEAA